MDNEKPLLKSQELKEEFYKAFNNDISSNNLSIP